MERINKDEYYLNIAYEVSKRSTCLKRRYGCVIVKNDVIVATGYNGSPRGEINCVDKEECQRWKAEKLTDYTKCRAVHAEQNAIISASHNDLIGSTIYLSCIESGAGKIPAYPCPICAKMLKNACIKRVVNSNGDINLNEWLYGE